MKLLRVGPVLASIAAAFLIQPVFGDAKPADVFETIPHGQPGSCDPDTIDTIVQEAITLNIKSIEALDTLLSKNLFSFFGKEARIGWIAEAMFEIWKKPGVNMQGMGFRFNEDEKQVLRKARGVCSSHLYFPKLCLSDNPVLDRRLQKVQRKATKPKPRWRKAGLWRRRLASCEELARSRMGLQGC